MTQRGIEDTACAIVRPLQQTASDLEALVYESAYVLKPNYTYPRNNAESATHDRQSSSTLHKLRIVTHGEEGGTIKTGYDVVWLQCRAADPVGDGSEQLHVGGLLGN